MAIIYSTQCPLCGHVGPLSYKLTQAGQNHARILREAEFGGRGSGQRTLRTWAATDRDADTLVGPVVEIWARDIVRLVQCWFGRGLLHRADVVRARVTELEHRMTDGVSRLDVLETGSAPSTARPGGIRTVGFGGLYRGKATARAGGVEDA